MVRNSGDEIAKRQADLQEAWLRYPLLYVEMITLSDPLILVLTSLCKHPLLVMSFI